VSSHGSVADEVDRRQESSPPGGRLSRSIERSILKFAPVFRAPDEAGRPTLPEFSVRPIRRADREQWSPLWRAYLTFYRAAESDEVTNATWARIFDPLEPVHALVAERDGGLIGFSHYLFQRSTWLLHPQCYLQDLYVEEERRGGGVGRALIGAVVGAAKEAGAVRVFWNTHETNAVARKLYDAVAERTGFIQYRIEPLG
jgi:GNAT superfamily N-acetyltransferase